MSEKGASRGAGRRFWSLPRKRRGAPGRHKPGESGGMAPPWGLRTSVPLDSNFLVMIQHSKPS